MLHNADDKILKDQSNMSQTKRLLATAVILAAQLVL